MNSATGSQSLPRIIQQADQDAAGLRDALGIATPAPVVLISGGADTLDPAIVPKLTQLIGRGLLRAGRAAGAVIIDGGTDAGVMALIGRAAAAGAEPITLIGVAPEALVQHPAISPAETAGDRVALAPNHTHFVLTQGDTWGAETPVMFDLAQAIAGKLPVIVVVIGGGQGTLSEILHAVRRHWRVLIIAGSKGAADELLAQWTTEVAKDDDPVIAEILADGDLHAFPIGDPPEVLARRIGRELGGDSTLRQAWLRFGALDLAAVGQQKFFRRMQGLILALTVGVTATVVLQQAIPDQCPIPFSGLELGCGPGLHFLVIIAPIALSVLIGWTNRFHHGKRWVLTRQAAEAIKREIFQFRTGATPYRDDSTREKDLAKAIEDVTRRLARSEANTTALPIYSGPIPPLYAAGEGDDGMSPLAPDRYIEVRLDDQLRFFRKKAVTLDTLLERLQWGILGAGGLGTLLAAIRFDLWVTLTTAVAAALGTYLSYRGVDSTLTNYNQTAIDLENIKGWWTALRPDEQGDPANVDALVQHTEEVLATELGGWTQRMQDALTNLRKAQEKEADGKGTESAGRMEGGPSLVVAARSDATPTALASQLPGAR
jgi:predicted Rossmann-fold nucleotide-binding protein